MVYLPKLFSFVCLFSSTFICHLLSSQCWPQAHSPPLLTSKVGFTRAVI